MKKFVTLFCVLMIPLTLTSDTQHRFKVYVQVYGEDKQAVSTIESHLNRELRLLGDVDVVGEDEDWELILDVISMAIKYKDGSETGSFVIGTYDAIRFREVDPDYKNPRDFKELIPTFAGTVAVAHSTREKLPEFCIQHVNDFDKKYLTLFRNNLKVN